MQLRWIDVPATQLVRGRSDVRVHTAAWGGPQDGPVFVAVHGLGGSHVNWALLAPRLAQRGTVFAPDLAGFGLTPPTGRTASVRDNVDLLGGFIRTVAPDRPVILLGNSMGGLLSILFAASRPALVDGLVLVAPATPRPLRAPLDPQVVGNFAAMAVPGLGERFMARRQRRLTPEAQVAETMALCVTDPAVLDPAVVAEHVEIVRRRRRLDYAHHAFLQAARSLLLLMGPRAVTTWALIRDVQAPTLLLHGTRDRLVSTTAIRALTSRRPDWTLVEYDGLGHIPMLEKPDLVADTIMEWLDKATTVTPESR